MTNVLEKALAHFAERKDSTVEIPEWGVTVHYSPLGMAERQRIVGAIRGGADNVSFTQAKMVAEKSRDGDGKPLFGEATPETIRKLQYEVDPNILDRIARAILGAPTEEEAAKN